MRSSGAAPAYTGPRSTKTSAWRGCFTEFPRGKASQVVACRLRVGAVEFLKKGLSGLTVRLSCENTRLTTFCWKRDWALL